MDYFLADDLSGALDAAAAFHGAGRRVRIVLSPLDWAEGPGDDVVGVTTETRNASPSEAAAIVADAVVRGQALGARLVYKKIDSTLRGPLGAELEALVRALPDARLLLAPANPLVGRTVRGGVLLVHGVPVAETEFGRDPACPVRESRVARHAAGIPSGRLLVPDTETPADLAAQVRAVASSGTPWVAIGSGALARPVAALLSGGGATAVSASVAPRFVGPPGVLLLGGSAHPANYAQAAALATQLGLPMRELTLADPAAAVDAAAGDLRTRGAALLLAETVRRDRAAMLATLTQAATELVRRTGVWRVFATGGETAFALCAQLGVRSLAFRAEIEPGLALATGRGPGDAGEWLLAVKPGGFGDVATWQRAWRVLTAPGGG